VGLAIASGGILYFVSHPSSRLSLIGLIPHTFYAIFAFLWALPSPEAPPGPPLAYITILLLALGKFFSYHIGRILFMLSARWELEE